MRVRQVGFIGALSAALVLSACGAAFYAEPAYEEVAYVPAVRGPYVETVYGGRTVYYLEGAWYFRRGARWAYFRTEPTELYRYRAYQVPRHYQVPSRERAVPVHEAPPSYRAPRVIVAPRAYQPPPEYRPPPARRQAPAARRQAPPARRQAPPSRGYERDSAPRN